MLVVSKKKYQAALDQLALAHAAEARWRGIAERAFNESKGLIA